MAEHQVVLIPGDGIGVEVSAAVQRIVEASGAIIQWHAVDAGGGAIKKHGTPLPQATLDAISEAGVALKGPLATPTGGGFRSVNVALRKKLDLYANFRPAKSIPGIPSRFDGVDVIVIRENTEGLYSGLEHEVAPGIVESLRIITEKASVRIARFAFETARRYNRRKVTCIHKANILKMSDGLFLRTVQKISSEFPDIECDDCIVDAAAMRLVVDPSRFDVLVMENLFGDILSDLTSGLVGGLGVTPSGNIGENIAVFEAVHGTAPDIAGKNLANPTALALSAALMLRRLDEHDAADRIENAIQTVIAKGATLTGDLGGRATTDQFTEAVIAAMKPAG